MGIVCGLGLSTPECLSDGGAARSGSNQAFQQSICATISSTIFHYCSKLRPRCRRGIVMDAHTQLDSILIPGCPADDRLVAPLLLQFFRMRFSASALDSPNIQAPDSRFSPSPHNMDECLMCRQTLVSGVEESLRRLRALSRRQLPHPQLHVREDSSW